MFFSDFQLTAGFIAHLLSAFLVLGLTRCVKLKVLRDQPDQLRWMAAFYVLLFLAFAGVLFSGMWPLTAFVTVISVMYAAFLVIGNATAAANPPC